MVCRCGDIEKCNADMVVLGEAQSKVGAMLIEADGIQEQIGLLKDKSPEAYEASNIEEICTALDKLDDEIKPALDSLLVGIHAVRNEVIQLLISLSEEDRLFHETEGKGEQ